MATENGSKWVVRAVVMDKKQETGNHEQQDLAKNKSHKSVCIFEISAQR